MIPMLQLSPTRPILPPEILHQIFLFITPGPAVELERGNGTRYPVDSALYQEPASSSAPFSLSIGHPSERSDSAEPDSASLLDEIPAATVSTITTAPFQTSPPTLFPCSTPALFSQPQSSPPPRPSQPVQSPSSPVFTPSSSFFSSSTPALIRTFLPIFLTSKAFYDIAVKIAYREIVGLKDPLMCVRFLKCLVLQDEEARTGEERGQTEVNVNAASYSSLSTPIPTPLPTQTPTPPQASAFRRRIKPSLVSLVKVLKVEWTTLSMLGSGWKIGSGLPRFRLPSVDLALNAGGGSGNVNGTGPDLGLQEDSREDYGIGAGDQANQSLGDNLSGKGKRREATMPGRSRSKMTPEELLEEVFEDEALKRSLGLEHSLYPYLHRGQNISCSYCGQGIVSRQSSECARSSNRRNTDGWDYDQSSDSDLDIDTRIHDDNEVAKGARSTKTGCPPMILEEKLLRLLTVALERMTGLTSLTLDLPTTLGVKVRMASLEMRKRRKRAQGHYPIDTDRDREQDNTSDSNYPGNDDDESNELQPLYDVLDGCTFQLHTFATSLPCRPPLAKFLNAQPEIRELTLRGSYMEYSSSLSFPGHSSSSPSLPESSPTLNPNFPIYASSLPNLQHLRTVHPSPYTPLPTLITPSRPIDSIHTSIVNHSTTPTVLDSLTRSGKKIKKLSVIVFDSRFGLEGLLNGLRERELDRELGALHIVAVVEDYTEEGLQVAGTLLESFQSLQYITYMACAGEPSGQLSISAERRIAKSWHDACPSLRTIILPRGAIWFEGKTGWDCLGDDEDEAEREQEMSGGGEGLIGGGGGEGGAVGAGNDQAS